MSLDLKLRYWQVRMKKECKVYMAFTVDLLGFYECEHMPFGLTNAPATFQHLMETCFGDLQLNWCNIYLDDITVFATIPKEHLKRLLAVLTKLWEAGLKLKSEKGEFFTEEIVYLCHIGSKDGVQTEECKIEAVHKWPVPHTVTEVRSFWGFPNYYHQFLKGYASIVQPLYDLVSGDNARKKNKSVNWTDQCQAAFDKIKGLCCTTPVLAFKDFAQHFLLHTDASGISLGVVIYQVIDRKECVIRYGFHSLNKGESCYMTHKLDFLALKWAVMMVFHEYLFGNQFTVKSDNNPLTYVLTTSQLDATGHGSAGFV